MVRSHCGRVPLLAAAMVGVIFEVQELLWNREMVKAGFYVNAGFFECIGQVSIFRTPFPLVMQFQAVSIIHLDPTHPRQLLWFI